MGGVNFYLPLNGILIHPALGSSKYILFPINTVNLGLKKLEKNSRCSKCVYPGNSPTFVLANLAYHVKVVNRPGFPSFLT